VNEKIRQHVAKFAESKGWSTDEKTLVEVIVEANIVWRGNESSRRWWTDCFMVVEVNGMMIGFDGAITTGDDSPREKGWEFNPETICEVEPREVTTTTYVRKA